MNVNLELVEQYLLLCNIHDLYIIHDVCVSIEITLFIDNYLSRKNDRPL